MKRIERTAIENLGGRVVVRKQVMEGWKRTRHRRSDGNWIGLLLQETR